ncbi:MAG: hypothetical protein CL916_12825 [Deltaproteobacteria bacterium]|nr:hypothetical protein [Deltaproteobacteria bacterium]
MIFILTLLGCTPDKSADSAEPPSKPVLAEIRLLDAIQGDTMGNVTLTSILDTQTTNEQGVATILVDEEESITIEASAPGYVPHHLELYSGRVNYSAVSLMASQSAAEQIFGFLSLTPDTTKGIIIVALDNPDLTPAVGAQASIDVDSDNSFILTSIAPEFGNEVKPNAGGFVAFPNVTAGTVNIQVTSPSDSTCIQHPAGATESATIEVLSGIVHVVFFTCSP